MEIDSESLVQAASIRTASLLWGVASRELAGESTSGDRFLVEQHAQGVLVAVVDGLGHGEEAARAAEAAIATLRGRAQEPIDSLLQHVHTALQGTRGGVMNLASFCTAENTLTWVGVGDVEGVLIRAKEGVRAREFIQQRGGIVGYRLPALKVTVVPVVPGDTLIFATDGVSRTFTEEPLGSDAPALAALRLLERHTKGTDDALLLVARYLGK